jgi:hypothetical protein
VTQADLFVLIAGLGAEAVVLMLLLYQRVYRTLPVLCLYVAWSLLNDAVEPALSKQYASSALTFFLVSLAIDSLFQFGVLLELSRSVLRPMAQFLPRWTSAAVAGLIVLVCAAVWPFSQLRVFSNFTPQEAMLLHLQQTFSILRILFFLVLAGCSQLLSIGWRDRELQIATGLGFYSMASVAVSILHTRRDLFEWYHGMDRFVGISYLCSLIYWVYCFSRQEAERREFTPQMQNFLLALAGTARSTRIALTDSANDKSRNRRK